MGSLSSLKMYWGGGLRQFSGGERSFDGVSCYASERLCCYVVSAENENRGLCVNSAAPTQHGRGNAIIGL